MMEGRKIKNCKNLENIHLTVATKEFVPFMFIKKIGNKTQATAGIDFQFLKLLSVGMNFQYSYIIPDDNKWGVLEENNSWSGIIGLVKREIADTGLSGLGIDFPRSQAVSFTVPYHYEQISFITRRSLEKSKTFAMVYPFTLKVWICLLFSLLIWTIVIYFTERMNGHLQGRRSLKFTSVLWYFFGSLVGKSGNTTRFKAPCIESLLSIWWIAVIAILSFYSSLLTSFITYPGFEPQIDTFSRLADAIDRDEIEADSIAGSAPYVVIKSGKSSVLRSLSRSVLSGGSQNLAHSIPEGVKMATERKLFAFIFTKTAIQTEAFMNYKDQKLFVSEDSMYTALGGMAISPKFKCRRTVNKYVKRFLHMGLFSKWKKELMEDSQRPMSLTKDIVPLALIDLQGPFYLLLFGLFVAFTSFLIEKLSNKCFKW